jgi:glutathione-independent formaldehyde dehydrogenase
MERRQGEKTNRGVVYQGPGNVKIQNLPFPTFTLDSSVQKRKCDHGVIIKNIATNICGSDEHMYRGRTTIQPGFVFGHEMLGEVIQTGRDVEFIKVGDIVSVPFNIACGCCSNCKKGFTNACLNTNPEQPGGIYGYVSGGGWTGGQTEYNMCPYADFNLLKIPNREKAMQKILDLSLLSDVLPTAFHAAIQGKVGTGSTVYVAGAGPVGLACARCCFLLGAAVVIVGDTNGERLQLAKSMGCYIVDLTKTPNLPEQIDKILGESFVEVAIDCVGYEARGHGTCCDNRPNQVLDDCIGVTKFGGNVSIPGVYLPQDMKGPTEESKVGRLTVDFGKGWNKGITYATGQTPVMRYNEKLMNLILWDRLTDLPSLLNLSVVNLDDAPRAYEEFNKGVAKKFVIDPHNMIASPK